MQQTASASTEELARLSELIGSIYQGATEPEHWNKVLPAISAWVGSPRCMILTPMLPADKGGFYFNNSVPEAFMQLYSTKYYAQDIWAIRAMERNLLYEGNVILSDEEVVSFDELSRTEFYQDFLFKQDTVHIMSGILFGLNSSGQLPMTTMTFHRGLKDGAFTSYERDRLKLLVPHLSRALGVMVRLRDADLRIVSSLSALDRLSSGVLLFGPQRQLVYANRAARRILEEEDGLRLRHLANVSGLGEVVAEDDEVHEALSTAVMGAVSPDILHTEHYSRAVLVPRPSGRQEYMLNFSSLASHNEFGAGSDAPRAIVFITDSAATIELDVELMKKTYGLTPAEIRVAESMAECLTVEEAAEQLGVSRATVKSQLQSIYQKTNTNNRAKLMRLIMSLAQIEK